MSGRRLPAGEGKRKLVHAAMAAFALLLPWLTWWQAALCALGAFGFNWLVLPRLLGHRLSSERADVSDRGVLLYPVVVLAMILVFWRDLTFAAVGWGFLAFGDATAGVAGMKWGRHPLPWNRGKSWEGLAGGLLGALAGGTLLLAFFDTRGFTVAWPTGSPTRWVLAWAVTVLAGAVVYALIESAPAAVDDNLLAPVLGALVVWAVAAPWWLEGLVQPPWPAWRTAVGGWLVALAVNGVCAVVAAWRRVLTPPGIAAALVLGVGTWGFGGLPLWIVLLVFLVVGTIVTRLGWRRKAALGIAEGDRGRRGLGNVAAKGVAVLAAAVLVPFAESGLVVIMGVAALAGALADTAGSELGKAFGRRAYSLPRLRSVPPGTDGAVSVAGTLATVAGAGLIAALAWRLHVVGVAGASLCAAAGVIAAFAESGFSRDVPHDAVNLTLTLVAASLAGSAAVLVGVVP